MGRRPKPIEHKLRAGNPGKRPLPSPASAPPGSPDLPDPPAGLQDTGRELWQRYWTVGAAWLSPDADYDLVARLCQAQDERAWLKRQIAQQGYFSAGSTGRLTVHPAVRELRAVNAEISRWESACGFTPVDRARLGITPGREESKLDDLLRRRRAARPPDATR